MFSARANLVRSSRNWFGSLRSVCSFGLNSAMGQSGRRLAKSPAVSVPTPEPKPPEKKPVANDQPQLTLVVGTDRGDVFAGVPSYYYDSVLQSCARRLNEAHVKLEVANNEMTRGDAVKRARAEKDGYVVWLQLRCGWLPLVTSSYNLDEIYLSNTRCSNRSRQKSKLGEPAIKARIAKAA